MRVLLREYENGGEQAWCKKAVPDHIERIWPTGHDRYLVISAQREWVMQRYSALALAVEVECRFTAGEKTQEQDRGGSLWNDYTRPVIGELEFASEAGGAESRAFG